MFTVKFVSLYRKLRGFTSVALFSKSHLNSFQSEISHEYGTDLRLLEAFGLQRDVNREITVFLNIYMILYRI
jgi:hypothetical protein